MTELELEDIQGIVISGYGKLSWAAFSLLHVRSKSGGKACLRKILPKITTAANRGHKWRMNIAVTATGLKALEVADDVLRTFSLQFTEGMADDDRSRILGDLGDNRPARWRWGAVSSPVDLLVMLYAADQATLEDKLQKFVGEAVSAGHVSEVVPAIRSEPGPTTPTGFGREHFGFADGISQPLIAGAIPPDHDRAEKVATLHGDYLPHATIEAGEFLFGYKNEYGRSAGELEVRRNGSYLVMRQLSQDVAGFWTFMDEQTAGVNGPDPEARVRLAAKMVGRWPAGRPLTADADVHAATHDVPASLNNLFFAERDPHGFGCPLGSHIRRANPRDTLDDDPKRSHGFSKRHRILRRGRNYGSFLADPLTAPPHEQKQERGLIFICLNANIARQFEFIQHTWLNNAKFSGLYDETDPLMGTRYQDRRTKDFTIQQQPIRRRVHGIGQFVTVKGGAYFFLPGISTIHLWADS